jgi:hypothetical protein
VGLTIAAIPVIIFWYPTLPYRGHLFWAGALIAAPFGYRAGIRLEKATEESDGEGVRAWWTVAAVSLFHFGAMLAFTVFLAEHPRFHWPAHFVSHSMVYYWFRRLILAFAILKIWSMFARYWRFRFGVEPLFFLGLYLGTFPSVIGAICSLETFKPLNPVLFWPAAFLDIPGAIANRNFFLSDHFQTPLFFQSTVTVVNSLFWGFVFLGVDLFLRWRKTKA